MNEMSRALLGALNTRHIRTARKEVRAQEAESLGVNGEDGVYGKWADSKARDTGRTSCHPKRLYFNQGVHR